ncbi:MAG: sporulation protein YunB [Bacillota bacterium]|nr:sporulation protein YunB [Bacillota bacterium]
MRRSYRGRNNNNPLFVIGVILLSFLILFEVKIRPMTKNLVQTESEVLANNAINQAVSDELKKTKYTYDDLVHVEYSSDHKIQSIRTDIVKMDQMKTDVALQAQQDVQNVKNEPIDLPIGNLFGAEIFQGKGPKMKLYITLTGSINVTYDSKFISAGINQTLHQIVLTVYSDITVACTGYGQHTHYKTNYVVAETVLVGDVPLVNSVSK